MAHRVAGVPAVAVSMEGIVRMLVPLEPDIDDAFRVAVERFQHGPGAEGFTMSTAGPSHLRLTCQAGYVRNVLQWLAKPDGTGALAALNDAADALRAGVRAAQAAAEQAAAAWAEQLGPNAGPGPGSG